MADVRSRTFAADEPNALLLPLIDMLRNDESPPDGPLVVTDQGLLQGARQCPSPNQNPRPAGAVVDLLVIHNISLPPGEFGGPWIDDFFANRLDTSVHPYFEEIEGLKVSAHLLIRRRGEIVQYVPFHRRAWHAGQSEFCGRCDCNDFSIGIELEGADDLAFEDAQYQTLARVSRILMRHYPGITAQRIAGHCDIAPGRKTDPGPAFDWRRYHALLAGDAPTDPD